jgi:dTMP kinase
MLRFISFEGGDGCGKTTQVKLLERHLVATGRRCLSTREPGGTRLGKMIREALLEVGKEQISSPTELLLYLADRAHHVQEVIGPALRGGTLVLCDRFIDSTVAYQGYGRGIDIDFLKLLNETASLGTTPDLTFLLDCPVDVALSRADRRLALLPFGQAQPDRFEREERLFHEKVRAGFLAIAAAEPQRIHVVDAARSPREIHEDIKGVVERKLR